ncbi:MULTISPECIES: condensation domain-containing protein [Clostridium]|uniref:condensation domain-containing protein n=1 Tax=Clostridium TaxID=1485 RepID=UPI0008252F0F|nr:MULTISPECIES: condensation domain-containing protein [Clostridium]PJI08542.1 siderophore synthetase [Clostridium sp. CT7]
MIFKSEIFDKLQFLFETYKFNDHNLHCIINFDVNINKAILEKAIIIMLDIAPILSSKYVENVKEPYWEKIDSSSFKNVLTFVNTKSEFDSFITSRTNEATGPQMKACLFSSNNDSLGILMNHMVCDAAGFKKYLYSLCSLYSNLLKNPDYKPNYILNGDRSINIINKQFSFKDKLKTFIFQSKESNGFINLNFPMSTEKEVKPFILTHEIPEDRFLSIKKYCKNHGVTINDATLAAFYRVLYKILNKNELSISVAVDMRKHLKDKNINALINLTATVISNIHYEPNDAFDDTVKKVHENMSLKKENFIGLNAFVKLSLLFKLFNYSHAKKLLKNGFKNPLIGMTNIGILDSKKLCFQSTTIKNAIMFGSMKYKPYFQLALTSYNNIMTFTINLYGNLKDKENIENFFALFDKELPK